MVLSLEFGDLVLEFGELFVGHAWGFLRLGQCDLELFALFANLGCEFLSFVALLLQCRLFRLRLEHCQRQHPHDPLRQVNQAAEKYLVELFGREFSACFRTNVLETFFETSEPFNVELHLPQEF